MAQLSAEQMEERLKAGIGFIHDQSDLKPKMAVILGSGLGDFADNLANKVKIPTAQIPFYPESTVEGHKGFLVFGNLEDVPVLALQGRTHVYEGHSIQDVAFSVRLMRKIGIKFLLVTNAAGGVNKLFSPGDLMIITDHINFLFRNPLNGPVLSGEQRWPDLFNAYDSNLIHVIENTGLELKIPLRKGVLFVSTGPSYETPAEIRMIKKLGGDAVSMSTVPEVLVARSNGIKVAGISCITNLASGLSEFALSHEEVTVIANLVKDKFQQLVKAVLLKMGNDI